MNRAEEIFTEADYLFIKQQVDDDELFEVDKAVEGFAFVNIHSAYIDQDIAENIWHGETYLIHFDEACTKGGYSGHGFATEKRNWLNTFEDFLDYLNREVCYRLPGYKDEGKAPIRFAEQMTLF